MRFLSGAVLLAAAALNVEAQRPASSSICDHYASVRYGSNTNATQLRLMQHIVALAFGGRGSLTDAPETSTGILNPGIFNNVPVNLRSWFDGSKATTNLNNQPIGINWLDGGGEAPLHAFVNQSVTTINIANTTNEYRLFSDFMTAFGFIFGCTGVRSFPKAPGASSGPINLAYAHKFMQLNSTHLGHFINQLTDAAKYYGFSTADADTLETAMNARYNVRCRPAESGQLYSLCQAEECPLAAPVADCAAYANLGPTVNNTGTGATGGSAPSSTTSTGPGPTSTSPAPAVSSVAEPVLTAGAIAGIAIGGAVVILAAIGMFLWHRRRRPKVVAVPYTGGPGGPASPAYPSYHTPTHNPHQSMSTYNGHQSYMSHTPSEAGTYAHFQPKPEDTLAAGAYHGHPQSPTLVSQPIAEMEANAQPTAWEIEHPSQGGVAAQNYAPGQTAATGVHEVNSPGVPGQEYAASTTGPNSPYQSTSPHQSGMPPDRRDNGPGQSVWQ